MKAVSLWPSFFLLDENMPIKYHNKRYHDNLQCPLLPEPAFILLQVSDSWVLHILHLILAVVRHKSEKVNIYLDTNISAVTNLCNI